MTLSPAQMRATGWALGGIAAAWLAAVVVAAESGALSTLEPYEIGPVIVGSMLLPALAARAVPRLRAFVAQVGLRPITALHMWRIPAGIAFIWYGAAGALPPLFWIPAGFGDLIAGLFAAWVVTRRSGVAQYRHFHIFGFADFAVAVGAGLAHSVAQDPLMAAVTVLPLAVIPMFGVGISGATHLIAFSLLRRGAQVAAA